MYPTRYFLRLEHQVTDKSPVTIGEVQLEILHLISTAIAAKEKALGITTPWTEEAIKNLYDFSSNINAFKTEIDKTPDLAPWELTPLTDCIYQHSCKVSVKNRMLSGLLYVELLFPANDQTRIKVQTIPPCAPDTTVAGWTLFRRQMAEKAEKMAMEMLINEWLKTKPAIEILIKPLSEHPHVFSLIMHAFYYQQIITNRILFSTVIFLDSTQTEFLKNPTIIQLQREGLIDFASLAATPTHPPELMRKLSLLTVHLLLKNQICRYEQLRQLPLPTLTLITQQAYANELVAKRLQLSDCKSLSAAQVEILSLPIIVFALQQGRLSFKTARSFDSALKSILISSWYVDYFRNPKLSWIPWVQFKEHHCALFLDKEIAPLVSQSILPANELLALRADQCKVLTSPLRALFLTKKILFTELKILSPRQVIRLLNSPLLMKLLTNQQESLVTISLYLATHESPHRQITYARALAMQCSRVMVAKKEIAFLTPLIQLAAKECDIPWEKFANEFLKELGRILRGLLQQTNFGLSNHVNQFDDYNFLNKLLFNLNTQDFITNLKTMELFLQTCATKSAAYSISPRLFQVQTPAQYFKHFCEQALVFKPLLQSFTQDLNAAKVGKSLRSPIA